MQNNRIMHTFEQYMYDYQVSHTNKLFFISNYGTLLMFHQKWGLSSYEVEIKSLLYILTKKSGFKN